MGLDTSAKSWHAVVQTDGMVGAFQEVRPDKNKDAEPVDVRRMHLHNSFKRHMAVDWPAGMHIFCEEPLALKNGKTTRLLGLAAGAIWAAHLEFDVFWHWVDVASWKKDVCGNGNIDKAGIQLWSLENGDGDPAWDQDHHDANCLSIYGLEALAKLT